MTDGQRHDRRHGLHDIPGEDALRELHFALAEADADVPRPTLRSRVRAAALATRAPGRPAVVREVVSGVEAFRRATTALGDVLFGLDAEQWRRQALRGLDVQGLLGHLIGVETAFAACLDGDPAAGTGDHVESTDAAARAQAGRRPSETLAEWHRRVAATIELAERFDPGASVTFYGITMPVDDLLVVRAFELWIHEEDIRRATGGHLADPDAGRLARMTELAMVLLPAGMARAERTPRERRVRLVLTGPGGGTWDVPLNGSVPPSAREAGTRIVVDAAAFCRVVGNRSDLVQSGAVVNGDPNLATDVFAGAAALALD